jgi:hypothetical protein
MALGASIAWSKVSAAPAQAPPVRAKCSVHELFLDLRLRRLWCVGVEDPHLLPRLGRNRSRRYNDLTAGFHWYWTERIRFMFDWIHPVTSPQTPFGATDSDILAMRFDFNS